MNPVKIASDEYLAFPALSPDGSRVAYSASQALQPYHLWLTDLRNGSKKKLTHGEIESDDALPSWSPKGDLIAYSATRKTGPVVVSIAADGSGGSTTLASAYQVQLSPDGEWLALSVLDTNDRFVLSAVRRSDLLPVPPATDNGSANFFSRTRDARGWIRISPDGKYVASSSNETGRSEIYVQRFPSGEGKWQVSTEGGAQPVWSPSGKELFFVRDNALFATPVTLGDTFTFGNPEKLFEPEAADLVLGYDVGRDAQRFLVVQRGANQNTAKIVVVENWQSSSQAKEPNN